MKNQDKYYEIVNAVAKACFISSNYLDMSTKEREEQIEHLSRERMMYDPRFKFIVDGCSHYLYSLIEN